MTEPGAPVDLSFDQGSAAYKLETERMAVLGQARLDTAKADSIDQHTVEQHLTNVIKARSLKEYDNDLKRFYANRYKHEAKATWLEAQGVALARYKMGDLINDALRSACWAAFLVLLNETDGSVIVSWSQLPGDPQWSLPENWVGRRTSGTLAPISVPEHFGSLASLISWQQKNYHSVVPIFGSPNHVATMQGLSMMNEYWRLKVKQYTEELIAIRAGTYDLWKPNDLLKLTDPV